MLTTKIKNLFVFFLGKHSARNATIITTGLSLFSKVFGYGRTLLVAYLFGATAFVDAYYVAFGAVGFIPAVLNDTIEAALLPSMIQNDEKTAKNLFGYAFRAFAVLILLISLLLLCFPEQYIKIFARAFDLARISYASNMVKWLVPFAIANLFIGLFAAWANYNNRFAVTSTIMAFANILVIPILLFLYLCVGDIALPAFQGIGYSLLAIIMWYVLKEVPIYPKGQIPPMLIKKVSSDMYLRLLASGAIFLYTLIDRYFASSLPVGNVAAISYANLLFLQPTGLTASAFSIYFVRANEKIARSEDSINLLFITLFMTASFFLPVAILLFVLARPIVELLLGYGAFDTHAVSLTFPCLAILALGLPVFIWNMILNKHAIAMGKLKVIVAWGYFGVLGNFSLDWLLVERYGAPGLCAATTIMWGISTICFMLFFCKPILAPLLKKLFPQAVLTASWAIPLIYTLKLIHNSVVALFIGTTVGLIHILFCEKVGLFDSIPQRWRPLSVLLQFKNKLQSYISKPH